MIDYNCKHLNERMMCKLKKKKCKSQTCDIKERKGTKW